MQKGQQSAKPKEHRQTQAKYERKMKKRGRHGIS
jgi:hypothetical protein